MFFMEMLNETLVTTSTEVFPEINIFGAGVVLIIGIIVLFFIIRYFLKIKK